MQSKSAALQDQINELDVAIQEGATDAQLNLWEMRRKELNEQLQTALAEEEQQQVTTEQAGFVFDTITVDGLTMPEIITDDVQYMYARKGVQSLVATLNISHSNLINALKEEQRQEVENLRECVSTEALRADQMQGDNKDLEVSNYQLGLDNDALSEKVRKGAELLNDANSQIEQQKKHISDLQTQISIGIRASLNVVEIPQDTTKLAADIIASKPRITNVQFKDKHGIDRRTKTAIEVLTGNEIEYQEYVEKRYVILNAEEAEQYRIYETNRKAELEAIPTKEEPENVTVEPLNNVLEEEVSTTEITFHETGHELGEGLLVDGANVSHEAHEEKEDSQVITLESLNARITRLEDSMYGKGLELKQAVA